MFAEAAEFCRRPSHRHGIQLLIVWNGANPDASDLEHELPLSADSGRSLDHKWSRKVATTAVVCDRAAAGAVRTTFRPLGKSGMSFFYGWVIVAVGIVVSCIGMGGVMSLGVFLEPMADTLGWSRS